MSTAGGRATRSQTLECDLGREESVLEDLPFRVTGKLLMMRSIVELELRPIERTLAYRPGQYVLFSDAEGGVPQRSFSIANAARADSSWVHDELEVGDTAWVEGPYGTFTQRLLLERSVLHLAAGSGLAPILALIEAALQPATGHRVMLLFSAPPVPTSTSGALSQPGRLDTPTSASFAP